MARFRAAIISDVHYGPDIRDKLGTKAPRLMNAFLKAAKNYDPDMIIDLGDRISAQNEDDDLKYLKSYCDHFNEVATPYHGVIGNHDDKNMTRELHAFFAGIPAQSYSIDEGGYHLVFWSPNRYVSAEIGIHIDQESIDWLRDDIAATNKPVLVFSHVPLDNLEEEGHRDVDKYFFWTQGDEVRRVLEDSGKVIMSMAGHRHRDRHREINGIHRITINSMVDTWKKHYRVPRGTFAFLEVTDDRILIQVKGKTPKIYDLKPKETAPAPKI